MCAELKKQIAYAIKKLRILYVIYDSNGHYYSLVQLFQRVRRGALTPSLSEWVLVPF